MNAWYESEEFTSHVREPDVADLLYMAKDLRLSDIQIVGRNWSGTVSPRRWVRVAARLFDHALRLRPSLCSDLYLIGRSLPKAGRNRAPGELRRALRGPTSH